MCGVELRAKPQRFLDVLQGMRSLVATFSVVAFVLSSGSAFAAITLGPAVQPHGPGRVTVLWGEDGNSEPRTVTLTSSGRPDRTATSRVTSGIHAAEFDDLVPGVEYRYSIGGRQGSFIAPPDASQEVRFAVFGDSRDGDAVHRQIVGQVVARRPDFYLTTGDDVARGDSLSEWKNFFEIERPLMATTPFSGVRGNHDVGALYENLVRLKSDTPGAGPTWGSLDIGPAHFLLLDTESSLAVGTPQYQFVQRDLSAHQGKPLFVLMHRPMFSSGWHGGAQNPGLAATLAPLFQKYGVDVVFQGHDHDYERSRPINGVTYVVTGGAGAPLRGVGRSEWTAISESVSHFVMVDVRPTWIRVTATRLDGTQLDAFEIDPRANDNRYTGNEPRPAPGGSGCAVQRVPRTGAATLFFVVLSVVLGRRTCRWIGRRRRDGSLHGRSKQTQTRQ